MRSLQQQEPVGLLIGAATRRIKQAVTARARRHWLSPRQFWVLVAVLEMDSPSLGELAARLRIDEPTASRVVGALARQRLVRVDADPRDRRRARLVATAAAVGRRRELSALAASIRGAVVARLAPAEEAALRLGLRRVIESMERFGSAARRRRARPGREGSS